MLIGRILYPVRVLGPGERIGIWTAGCRRHCKGCANPELQPETKDKDIPLDTLFSLLCKLFKEHQVTGVTISGGEPFIQTEELSELVRFLSGYTDDILIYTGYRIETLKKRKRLKEETGFIINRAAVIIDGTYSEEKNFCHPLKGSDNQRIIYRDRKIRKIYEEYINEKYGRNEVQNFRSKDGLIAVGIHKKEFVYDFNCGGNN